ncbi:MAG: hypothetical protein GY928_02275 [Colwellia sp.]|nr:hypothetical protein [Colwellia sp.]
MKKQTRDFKIKFNFNWLYGITISEIRKDLDYLEELGANIIHIEIEDDYATIDAISNRLETDKEFEERIERTNKQNDLIRVKELEQLKMLKNKYDNDNDNE